MSSLRADSEYNFWGKSVNIAVALDTYWLLILPPAPEQLSYLTILLPTQFSFLNLGHFDGGEPYSLVAWVCLSLIKDEPNFNQQSWGQGEVGKDTERTVGGKTCHDSSAGGAMEVSGMFKGIAQRLPHDIGNSSRLSWALGVAMTQDTPTPGEDLWDTVPYTPGCAWEGRTLSFTHCATLQDRSFSIKFP